MKATYDNKPHRFFIILSAIAVLCCILTGASYKTGVSNIFASAIGVAVTPIQSLFGGIHNFFEDKAVYFKELSVLQQENERLQAENSSLHRKLVELAPTKKENEMLYRFLELKKERIDLHFVSADVISRSVSNYTSEFTLNKGSLHGLEKNMAVVCEDTSLLGILTEVGATYSRGKTITSYDIAIGVKNERSGEPGLLSGSVSLERSGLCQVADLTDKADYLPGDTLCTSSLGDIYPPGLYVGIVSELIPDGNTYTLNAIVRPSKSVYDTDKVMIITGFDRNYEIPAQDRPNDTVTATEVAQTKEKDG